MIGMESASPYTARRKMLKLVKRYFNCESAAMVSKKPIERFATLKNFGGMVDIFSIVLSWWSLLCLPCASRQRNT